MRGYERVKGWFVVLLLVAAMGFAGWIEEQDRVAGNSSDRPDYRVAIDGQGEPQLVRFSRR